MMEKIRFKFFQADDIDKHSFYRIPKQLFTDSYFKGLSSDAKILYGLMLDRISLSVKNRWLDEQNRAYIYFSIEEVMEMLDCGKNKAIPHVAPRLFLSRELPGEHLDPGSL